MFQHLAKDCLEGKGWVQLSPAHRLALRLHITMSHEDGLHGARSLGGQAATQNQGH